MKERVLDEMFIAYATPIIGIDKYGYYEYGNNAEYFIINPIVRKNFFGKEKIVGGIETISKIKLFNCYSPDELAENDILIFEDVESKEYNIGGIRWSANMSESVDKILEKEELDKYLSQTPGNILDKIIKVRKSFKEIAKTDTPIRVLK